MTPLFNTLYSLTLFSALAAFKLWNDRRRQRILCTHSAQ